MDMVCKFGQMDPDMKVIGLMGSSMDKECYITQMEMYIMENGWVENARDMEGIVMCLEQLMKEIGIKTISMVKD